MQSSRCACHYNYYYRSLWSNTNSALITVWHHIKPNPFSLLMWFAHTQCGFCCDGNAVSVSIFLIYWIISNIIKTNFRYKKMKQIAWAESQTHRQREGEREIGRKVGFPIKIVTKDKQLTNLLLCRIEESIIQYQSLELMRNSLANNNYDNDAWWTACPQMVCISWAEFSSHLRFIKTTFYLYRKQIMHWCIGQSEDNIWLHSCVYFCPFGFTLFISWIPINCMCAFKC